ncbi:MAG: oxygen-independent coproporphyrinogen III oxidase [Chlamydiia bacterium]|nr:oxygen-independent coproporphyrinogen III oxidase [Chlamydiia bacterium]
METISLALLKKLHQPVPRYTSYPTAVEFKPLAPSIYHKKLSQTNGPFSLYFHIPFCHAMCLYCACSVILNRKPEKETAYIHYLIKEIDLMADLLGRQEKVTQLHFGGGTPTKIHPDLLKKLFTHICNRFEVDFDQEIAIEIDPRTVLENEGEKLRLLRHLGFNRVSFGVQDTNVRVQDAIRRRQSYEMTEKTYNLARTLGFRAINIDLIYGLPYQTEETFDQTITDILCMKPDRIALFSYAKVPWLKPHQRAIKSETLPSIEQKFAIYANARRRLTQNGYWAMGMDHFALEDDEMVLAFREGRLQRNFQGYTVRLADEMLGFGVTSIGCVNNTYVQNTKDLREYYSALDRKELPIVKGIVMKDDDILRKWIIHQLMCSFTLDKKEVERRFRIDFSTYFATSLKFLKPYIAEGFVIDTPHALSITQKGELFIRNLVLCFDAYSNKSTLTPQFSQSI